MKIPSYPPQRPTVGCRVKVVFHFDERQIFPGVIVRDDKEEPYVMLVQIGEGQFVLGTECQWRPDDPRLDEYLGTHT